MSISVFLLILYFYVYGQKVDMYYHAPCSIVFVICCCFFYENINLKETHRLLVRGRLLIYFKCSGSSSQFKSLRWWRAEGLCGVRLG